MPEPPILAQRSRDRPPSSEGPRFDEIFRSQARYVAAVALRILGRREEVEDVVQDVFLVVASKGLDEVPDEAVRSWLKTVTVRKARERLGQRRWARWLGLDDAPEAADLLSRDATPVERLMMRRLYAALDRLPRDQRVAWILRYVEGERLEDVARLTGCSLATAKRRIAAAHAKVLEELPRD